MADRILETARALKPNRVVHLDRRGGQVWALNGLTATIRAHAEQHLIRDYVVATELLPAGAIVGDAVVVMVAGAFPYTIAAIERGRFADDPGIPSASVARGIFSPATIPYSAMEGRFW